MRMLLRKYAVKGRKNGLAQGAGWENPNGVHELRCLGQILANQLWEADGSSRFVCI